MWALTDFTDDNGATRIVPGSHRAPSSPELGARLRDPAATMRRGSILVFDGSVWHGGGANAHGRASRRHRHELLRRLDAPAGEPAARHPARGRARLLRRKLRKLVGFGIYRSLIGHIDKCSPVDLLDGSRPAPRRRRVAAARRRCGGAATTTTLRSLSAALGDDAPARATKTAAKAANLRG